jgi:uncharacterized protein (DUF433 family)/DNA-binding transcriptional MerR regulator
MAYPAPVAAALSGATVRQLAYWRSPRAAKGALLVPEYRPSPGRLLYSFRDVVALRTFVYLREGFSLQKVRKALEQLPSDVDHISTCRLLIVGKSIVLARDDEEHFGLDLLEAPGQERMVAVMRDVVKPFPTRTGETVVDLYRPRPRLAVDPDVRSGYPVIAGTRIPFDQVSTLVADGVPPSEVKQFYPGVSSPAARDAFSFAEYVAVLKAAS